MWYRQTLLHHPSLFKYIPRALSVTAPLSSASDYARELYCICTLRTVRTGFFGYTHQFRIGMDKSEVGLTTFGRLQAFERYARITMTNKCYCFIESNFMVLAFDDQFC